MIIGDPQWIFSEERGSWSGINSSTSFGSISFVRWSRHFCVSGSSDGVRFFDFKNLQIYGKDSENLIIVVPMGRKIFPCCFASARVFRIYAGKIKGSKWSFWLEIISSETGLNVQRPTCKQRNCIQTFFSFNFSISSGVKWSEAVGAAAEPISCAKKVWYHCSFSFSYLI